MKDKVDKSITALLIDDAGWGFPLLGVVFGIHNLQTNETSFVEVPVQYFQPAMFISQAYLAESGRRVVDFLAHDLFVPAACKVDICPGFVNNGIAEALSKAGYAVNRKAIGEPLQSRLENAYAKYVYEKTGKNLYYDPKGMSKSEIARRFFKVINWVKASNRFDIAKTGWKYFKKQERAWKKLIAN